MAEHAVDYHRGEMDIAEQRATFEGFMGLTKWGSLVTADALLFFALIFAAHAGFFQALGAAVVVAIVGVLMLREKKSAH